MPDSLVPIVTCEHGGNWIPKKYAPLFAGQADLLASHRGWDPGALALARATARSLQVPLHFSRVSRLVVDLNRSPHHPRLFSTTTRRLPAEEREEILRRWYRPYRRRVTGVVESEVALGRTVLHLAIHSFVPVLDGVERSAEVGLLFDPRRRTERAFCESVRRDLRQRLGGGAGRVRVRFNQPYRGVADGLPTWLRKQFAPSRYMGIELEVSQGLILAGGREWTRARRAIVEALRSSADEWVRLPSQRARSSIPS